MMLRGHPAAQIARDFSVSRFAIARHVASHLASTPPPSASPDAQAADQDRRSRNEKLFDAAVGHTADVLRQAQAQGDQGGRLRAAARLARLAEMAPKIVREGAVPEGDQVPGRIVIYTPTQGETLDPDAYRAWYARLLPPDEYAVWFEQRQAQDVVEVWLPDNGRDDG